MARCSDQLWSSLLSLWSQLSLSPAPIAHGAYICCLEGRARNQWASVQKTAHQLTYMGQGVICNHKTIIVPTPDQEEPINTANPYAYLSLTAFTPCGFICIFNRVQNHLHVHQYSKYFSSSNPLNQRHRLPLWSPDGRRPVTFKSLPVTVMPPWSPGTSNMVSKTKKELKKRT